MSTTYSIIMTSNSSHIRSTPKYDSSGGNVLGYTQKNEKYTATAYQNGWYKITRKANNKTVTGWVYQGANKEFVKLLGTNTVSTTPTTDAAKKKTTDTKNKPNTTTTKNTVPQQTSKQQTVSVPAVTDMMDHAITFSPDEQESIKGSYTTDSRFIFKNRVTGYNYDDGMDYIRSMTDKKYLKNYSSFDRMDFFDNGINDKYGDISEALKFIKESQDILGLKDRDKLFNRFNRYKIPVVDAQSTKLIPYVFFTKSMLNMVDNTGQLTPMGEGDPFWESLYKDEPRNFYNLDAHYTAKGHDFNCLLSNAVMSFQASDEVLKTVEHGETYTGWKMVYGRNTNESNTAGQFSISYIDDHNFNIYKMHKIWVEYINRVYRGEMPGAKAKKDELTYNIFRNHIYKKILTYPCAVYYIVCAADGETILYWCKYYGVFPVNTPASVASWTHGSPTSLPEFSINYMYSIKEDFHPVILSEFNMHSKSERIYRPIYNPDTNTNSPTFVGAPYVETVRNDGKMSFKLRFRD